LYDYAIESFCTTFIRAEQDKKINVKDLRVCVVRGIVVEKLEMKAEFPVRIPAGGRDARLRTSIIYERKQMKTAVCARR
jgi:hypothetical protein